MKKAVPSEDQLRTRIARLRRELENATKALVAIKGTTDLEDKIEQLTKQIKVLQDQIRQLEARTPYTIWPTNWPYYYRWPQYDPMIQLTDGWEYKPSTTISVGGTNGYQYDGGTTSSKPFETIN